nr:transposase [Bradyrhizobium arachidis]
MTLRLSSLLLKNPWSRGKECAGEWDNNVLMAHGRCLRPALYSSLRPSPSHTAGASTVRGTIAIANARKQRARKLAAESRRLFRNESDASRRIRAGGMEGSTAMTRTAFCRKSPRAPSWLGSWAAGISGRGTMTAGRLFKSGFERPVHGDSRPCGRIRSSVQRLRCSLPHRRAPMKLYVGLDVALEETSLCIVDGEGLTVREVKVMTEPAAIRSAVEGYADRLKRVGVEASSLGIWLCRELQPAGLPIIVVEPRHMRVSLSTMRNKTDRNDARISKQGDVAVREALCEAAASLLAAGSGNGRHCERGACGSPNDRACCAQSPRPRGSSQAFCTECGSARPTSTSDSSPGHAAAVV